MSSDTTKRIVAIVLTVLAVGLCIYVLWGRKTRTYTEAPRDSDYWIRKADHPDVRTECQALAKLGRMKDPAVVPVLIEKLEKGRPAASAQAARGLALHGKGQKAVADKALPALTKQLERESTIVKFAVVKALRDIGDPRSLPGLQGQVRTNSVVAADAAWAIGRLKDGKTGGIPRAAEDALIGYLSSPIPRIRLGALLGLRDGGTRRALPALETLKADPLGGLDHKFISTPIVEGRVAEPDWIGRPCREAIKAIRARMKKTEGTS